MYITFFVLHTKSNILSIFAGLNLLIGKNVNEVSSHINNIELKMLILP